MRSKISIVSLLVALGAGSANAAPQTSLWIDDTSGNIGLVNLSTGNVTLVNNTGEPLTDIGFIGTQMYGTTFTGLVKIDDQTGSSTPIGSYGAVGGGGMNALVGNGTGLLAASNAVNEVFNVDPATGIATNNKAVPLPSAGDLAFSGNTLYESAVGSMGDALVNVTTGTVIGSFIPESSLVFGIADDGTTMFAVAGTEVFTVNLATAALTPLLDYSGHGLGVANGTAFVAENVAPGGTSVVPEPSTWAMAILGTGFLAFVGMRKRKRSSVNFAV